MPTGLSCPGPSPHPHSHQLAQILTFLFSISAREREAMEAYMKDRLAAGLIFPSASPAGAAFFFVEMKDKTLRPYIDYQGRNYIMIKNHYRMPLISSV